MEARCPVIDLFKCFHKAQDFILCKEGSISSFLLVFLMITSVFIPRLVVATAKSSSIIVPDDYPTIQEAINAANPGMTVYVREGTYKENILINKSISLTGEKIYNTIIDGSGLDDVIQVSSNDVEISCFTIEDSGNSYLGPFSVGDAGIELDKVSNCSINNIFISNTTLGIALNSSTKNIISNNFVLSNNKEGIFLTSSNNNSIINNTSSMNGGHGGIWIASSSGNRVVSNICQWNKDHGIKLIKFSKSNILENNTLSYNRNSGIYLSWKSNHNLIVKNTISKQRSGIDLHSSSYNTLENNKLSKNDVGISLAGPPQHPQLPPSSNNTLKNNLIRSNEHGISLDSAQDNDLILNILELNHRGVNLRSSHRNRLGCNLFRSNYAGIVFESSRDNRIFNNTIRDNSIGIRFTGNNSDGNGIKWNNIKGNELGIGYDFGGYETPQSVLELKATYNWWGDQSGPYHKKTNPFGEGEAVSDHIQFTPWLNVSVPTLPLSDDKKIRNETKMEDYDSFKDKYDELKSEHEELKSKYESLRNDYESLQSLYESLKTDYQKLKNTLKDYKKDHTINDTATEEWEKPVIIAENLKWEMRVPYMDVFLNDYHIDVLGKITYLGQNGVTLPFIIDDEHYQMMTENMPQYLHGSDVKVYSFLTLHPREFSKKSYSVSPGEVYNWAFSDLYYRTTKKWRYPNNTIIRDPYKGGAAKSFFNDILLFRKRTIDGQINSEVYMCLNNPYWLEYQIKSARRCINKNIDIIYMENTDRFPFYSTGCFSYWCITGFRYYLTQKYSYDDLRNIGIDDLSTFNIVDYIEEHYSTQIREIKRYDDGGASLYIDQSEALSDKIIKEYILFQYHSYLSFFTKYLDSVKDYGSSKGKKIGFMGDLSLGTYDHVLKNQPANRLLGSITDIIKVNIPVKILHSVNRPEKTRLAKSSISYKVARAMGENNKPVWVSRDYNIIMRGRTSKILQILGIAEAYASGCKHIINLRTFTDKIGTKYPDVRYETREDIKEIYTFIHENRGLFKSTRSYSKIALISSEPTLMWNFIPFLNISPSKHERSFTGYAWALEKAHLPFDVLFLDHPEFTKNSQLSDELSLYDAIILPNVESMSDNQINQILNYVEEGGGLVLVGENGIYDEDYNRRKTQPIFNSNTKEIKKTFGEGKIVDLRRNPSEEFFSGKIEGEFDSSDFKLLIDSVQSCKNGELLLETNASDSILINPFIQPSKNYRTIIHLLDYNFTDINKDYSNKNIKINIELPTGIEAAYITLLSPFTNKSSYLDFKSSADRIEFNAPNNGWNIVKITSKMEIRKEINEVETSIKEAINDGRKYKIKETKNKISEAKSYYNSSKYAESHTSVIQAKKYIEQSHQHAVAFQYVTWALIFIAGVLILLLLFIYLKRKRSTHP